MHLYARSCPSHGIGKASKDGKRIIVTLGTVAVDADAAVAAVVASTEAPAK